MSIRFTVGLVCIFASGLVTAQPYRPVPEQPQSDIGYANPKDAEAALRVKPGVTVSEKDGWFVFVDTTERTVWTIAMPSNRAYPTAVKRSVVKSDQGSSLNMKVQCGASKEVCDDVVRSFNSLNDRTIEAAHH